MRATRNEQALRAAKRNDDYPAALKKENSTTTTTTNTYLTKIKIILKPLREYM